MHDFLSALQADKDTDAQVENQERDFTLAQTKAITDAIEANNKTLADLAKQIKAIPAPLTSVATPDADKVVKAVQGLNKTLRPMAHDDTSVVNAITKQTMTLAKQIEQQIISPVVNVPAPIVNVPEADFTKLEKAITNAKPEAIDLSVLSKQMEANSKATKKVGELIQGLVFPVANTPTDPLIKYAEADIDDNGTIKYYGYTQVNGSWYIKRYDTTATPKTIRFCFGSGKDALGTYAVALANRATLPYTLWGT